MSAFIVSDLQYSIMADSISFYLGYSIDKARDYMNILKRENIRSVNYRYKEKTRFYPVDFKPCQVVPIEQVINFLQCVGYQSCERPDYEKSKAFCLNMKLQTNLYKTMINSIKPNLFNNLEWSV